MEVVLCYVVTTVWVASQAFVLAYEFFGWEFLR